MRKELVLSGLAWVMVSEECVERREVVSEDSREAYSEESGVDVYLLGFVVG